jgi:NodT family efflux transporter outer membrane factor (OMF) lipoprotein
MLPRFEQRRVERSVVARAPAGRQRARLSGIAVLVALALQGCSLAPTYKAPTVALPAHYAEQVGPWHSVSTSAQLPAQWWQLYHDPHLDALQQQLLKANPDLAAAIAHFDAASAYATGLHGGLWPQANATVNPVRQRQSDSRPLRGDTQPSVYNSDTAGFSLSFDLDLWGRIRNQVAAGDAQAQASGDDLAAAQLSLQQQLATLYVQARGLDAQRRILDHSLSDYNQALQLTQDRYDGKIASQLDLNRAQSQLAQARAQRDDVQAQRDLAEHAIAELVGKLPSDFSLADDQPLMALPTVPTDLPSGLLQRRPDVAAAERRVFAANANIGVARAAWYPDFSLSGLLGGQTQGVGNLLSSANRYWAIGPVINLPLFDGGRRSAADQQAKAEFDEAAAQYHSKVLHAVREVEDNLGQLRNLELEAVDQKAAVDAANSAQQIAMSSYQGGAASYLDVVTAQTTALQAQRQLLDVQTRQVQASVSLVVALGGGWQG